MIIVGSVAQTACESDRNTGIDLKRFADLDLIGTYQDAQRFARKFQAVTNIPINDGKTCYLVIPDRGYYAKDNDHFKVEIELAWPGSTAEKLMHLVEANEPKFTKIQFHRYGGSEELAYAPLDALYALKMSHRFKRNTPFFEKTHNHITEMRARGAKIPEKYRLWFKQREAATYNYGHPKLNQSKKEFFSDDGIQYEYDHDSIHEIMKYGEKPAYTFFKEDQSEVKVCKALWDTLDDRTKLQAVMEESQVLALERSQIPFRNEIHPHKSFIMALQKVCTSITSGWFREYAWEHYWDALAQYDTSYAHNFFRAVERGAIKPLQKD